MEAMGHSMTVRYPEMRTNVRSALRMIARARDADYWRNKPHFTSYFPGLCIGILYDDDEVFPDPDQVVGTVIFENEAAAFKRLFLEYDPLVDAYDAEDGVGHVNDPRWPAVERAARDVLRQMSKNDATTSPQAKDLGV